MVYHFIVDIKKLQTSLIIIHLVEQVLMAVGGGEVFLTVMVNEVFLQARFS